MPKISLLPPIEDVNGEETVVLVKGGQTRRGLLGPLVGAAVAPYLDEASASATAAAAFSNFIVGDLANAESSTEEGERFSISDDGVLVAYIRTGDGSLEIGRAVTPNFLAGTAGPGSIYGGLPGITLHDVLQELTLIGATAHIGNPRWGAPRGANASDPAFAGQNTAAINSMLASGAKTVILDDKARHINDTLLVPSGGITITGPGRGTLCLVYIGPDKPLLARYNYAVADADGVSDVTLRDMRIKDLAASRVNHWTIDLSNAVRPALENVQIDGSAGLFVTDKYGALLGRRPESGYQGPVFGARVHSVCTVAAKVMINGSDSNIDGDNQFWAQNPGTGSRDAALVIGGNTTLTGGQMVPGTEAGILFWNDLGFGVEMPVINGIYIDGNDIPLASEDHLLTGYGIAAADGITLIDPQISCKIWHTNKGGARFGRVVGGRLSIDFLDCNSDDSDDEDEDDLIIAEAESVDIRTVHRRGLEGDQIGTKAPKTESARLVTNSPLKINVREGVGTPTTVLAKVRGPYSAAQYVSNGRLDVLEGTDVLAQYTYEFIPSPEVMFGRTITYQIEPGFRVRLWSDQVLWQGGVILLAGGEDMNNLRLFAVYRTGNIAAHANFPAGMAGEAYIEVFATAAGFTSQKVREVGTGIEKVRTRNGGVWGAWLP